MLYRQGDILLKPIQELPIIRKKKDLILAYGESTGHMHQFVDPMNVSVFLANEQQYVSISNDFAELVHNEHATLQIPQGNYRVIQQREVDLTEEIRQVID